MSAPKNELEAKVTELEANTRKELAGDLLEDREKLMEALLFVAGQMRHTGDYGEYGPHIGDLADVIVSLEHVALEIDRHDERQAFARRALENEVGRSS